MPGGSDLQDWYRSRREAYPWRRIGSDPYLTLVSEVMLQQTQAARVVSAFPRFVRRFPTVSALAGASRAEVLRAWSGLGYNRRAVALVRAARAIVRDHGGEVPEDIAGLRSLPGIGPYTAAAVASIAHGAIFPAIDVNVSRVVARARLGREPHEVSRAELEGAARAWVDPVDPGSWNQAVMDVGREFCRPAPRCSGCPLGPACRYRRAGRTVARQAVREVDRRPFRGSFRQLRGSVLRLLSSRPIVSLRTLAASSGEPVDRVAAAVKALHAEGLVEAGPQALAGRPSGRIRLAESSPVRRAVRTTRPVPGAWPGSRG